MQMLKRLLVLSISSVLLFPALSEARQNTLTAGLGVSLDYSDRTYDQPADDPNTEIDESAAVRTGQDDYKRFVLTPLIHFISSDVRDNFELRAAPGIKYDLDESGTDWDSNLFVSADRYMTRSWQLEASNSFIISDYYDNNTSAIVTDPSASIIATEPVAVSSSQIDQPSDPQLSPDIGRTRYWSNTFRIGSNYTYKEDSLFRVGFDYRVLRNDEDEVSSVEDYDRYALNFRDEHRFSPIWNTVVDLLFVRGDFESIDPGVADAVIGEIAPEADITPTEEDLSQDLKEYHLLFTVENASIAQNPLFLSYNYIGTDYDAALRSDGDIHQARLTWRHDYSPRLYTRLGAGPSYEKTDGRDAYWDYNGIAELNYLTERGNLNFTVEKLFTVDNFSGTRDRGFVDLWDARFTFDYSLTQHLTTQARIGYTNEDRTDPLVAIERVVTTDVPQEALTDDTLSELEEYQRERYYAGIGFSYLFWQDYTASVDYLFTRQESDQFFDDYDDHRLILTLSWQTELFRW